ncbi:MAG: hypothetical protein DRO73_02420 [Candidatus Thorarchaeota archaeon]|nr:MAG: hypothetical protein DRO73_02420 [Candidatus Thorarchaeota archaeon]RLI59670.1 MAG: hypothetical protein DRO93_08130 [Candidatus Thorarchaeota archaeon]
MINLPNDTAAIARTFAPILHFHPDEGKWCCFPSDAEEIYSRFHDNWQEFKMDLTPSELDPDAPCYYEVAQHDGWTQIRYWFWYRYNRFPGGRFGMGYHLGDWEHVEVRVYPQLEDGVVIWLLSNHLSARLGARPSYMTLPGFLPEPVTEEDNHVHTWVALGSHAHYPSPTSRPFTVARFWRDQIADGGPVWHTADSLKPLSETNFFHFTGRWGDKKAPRSPTNGYNNPWRNAPNVLPVRYNSQVSD